MKTIELATSNLSTECQTDTPLAGGLLALQLDVPMMCGGKGRCATCHVHVVEGMENLSPVANREELALNMLSQRLPNSRLSCQARVRGRVVVKLPDSSYVEGVAELEAMVGRRAERDILLAKDGRVLVARGQLVSRYVVNKLKEQFSAPPGAGNAHQGD